MVPRAFHLLTGIVLAASVIATAAIAETKTAAAPRVEGAMLTLAIVPGRPAAIHATIVGGASPDRLIGVEGPAPARFELHATMSDNGIVRMRRVETLAIAASARVALKPGGMHVMVFDLPATKPGAMVPLSFVFEKAGRVTASAHAMTAGAGGHHH